MSRAKHSNVIDTSGLLSDLGVVLCYDMEQSLAHDVEVLDELQFSCAFRMVLKLARDIVTADDIALIAEALSAHAFNLIDPSGVALDLRRNLDQVFMLIVFVLELRNPIDAEWVGPLDAGIELTICLADNPLRLEADAALMFGGFKGRV